MLCGAPATVLGEFEHHLQGATLGGSSEGDTDVDGIVSDSAIVAVEEALDHVLKRANAFAKGGLLTLGELGKLVKQLKDEQ